MAFFSTKDIYHQIPNLGAMRLLTVVWALLLVFMGSALAQTITFDDIAHAADVYNTSIENAPGVVKSLLGDEVVEINIVRDDGSSLLAGLVMENAEVVEVIRGVPEDPSIVVKAKEDAIVRIMTAEDPVDVFNQARDDGEVDIRGMNFWSKAKVKSALASTAVLKFFADAITNR